MKLRRGRLALALRHHGHFPQGSDAVFQGRMRAEQRRQSLRAEHRLDACSRLTGCAPLDQSAILSEKKYANPLPITATISTIVMPLRPPKYAPRVMSTSVSAVNRNVVRRTLIEFPYHYICNPGPSSIVSSA